MKQKQNTIKVGFILMMILLAISLMPLHMVLAFDGESEKNISGVISAQNVSSFSVESGTPSVAMPIETTSTVVNPVIAPLSPISNYDLVQEDDVNKLKITIVPITNTSLASEKGYEITVVESILADDVRNVDRPQYGARVAKSCTVHWYFWILTGVVLLWIRKKRMENTREYMATRVSGDLDV